MSKPSQNHRRVHLNDLEDVLIFGIALLPTEILVALKMSLIVFSVARSKSVGSRAIPNTKTSSKSFM